MIDLPTLKALAEKATPGPYDVPPPHPYFGFAVWANRMCVARFGHSKFDEHNAEYFAAASPATVLAIIARVEELEAALVEIWSSVPATYDNDDPMVQRHARALNAVAALLKERVGK